METTLLSNVHAFDFILKITAQTLCTFSKLSLIWKDLLLIEAMQTKPMIK